MRSGSLVQPIRVYRHPGTGEEAHLSAGPITGPAGQWWEVRLVRADGRPGAVAGQTAVDWCRSREAAQEGYRKRLQALRAAGWVRVDGASPFLLVVTDRRHKVPA